MFHFFIISFDKSDCTDNRIDSNLSHGNNNKDTRGFVAARTVRQRRLDVRTLCLSKQELNNIYTFTSILN
jgi:hypothetical protein